MKKQHVSLLLLGISLCYNATVVAQTHWKERTLDRQVATAKRQGLFRQSYSPFVMEEVTTRRMKQEVVAGATYLQLQPAQTQQLYRTQPEALTLSIPTTASGTLELELIQQTPFDKSFFVSTSADINKPVAYTPGVYYRGVVKGVPQSTVAVSIFENEIIGIAATPEQGNLVLGRLQADGNGQNYILYSDKNLKASALPACETVEPPGYTEKIRAYMNTAEKPTAGKCVKVYLECDYALHQSKGGVTGVTNFVTAIFNNLAVLYANEQITTKISQVMVWTTPDPYSITSSYDALNTFRTTRTTFNGDLAHLVTLGGQGTGGRGYIDVLCFNNYRYAYSNINSYYSTVPTYSWSVYVMTHEMGHNLGSPHTQSCSWTGGALDNCYPTEESCAPGPAPANGGTMMSYCHLTSTGINFNNGFGTQPGNLIRNRVNAASCLGTCDTTVPSGCTTNSATLTIVLDNYPNEVSWNIKDSASQMVASGGPYAGTAPGTIVTEALCLPNGCYTLTMSDAWGDGICCFEGNGSYSLSSNPTNTVLASGGEYLTQDIKTFCFGAGTPSVPGETKESVSGVPFEVYPNPAKDVLNVRWNSDEASMAALLLTDLAGKQMSLYKVASVKGRNNVTIPLHQLPVGMYLIKLQTRETQFQQKIMVQRP